MSADCSHQEPQRKNSKTEDYARSVPPGTPLLLTDPVIPPGKVVKRIRLPNGLVRDTFVDPPEPGRKEPPGPAESDPPLDKP